MTPLACRGKIRKAFCPWELAVKPLVAIVGRPNVGKSTLFNRILGRRKAIVEDMPGVTRDRNYADVEFGGRSFALVDTGGFDPEAADGMLALMKRQVSMALEEADALVVVVDGPDGLTPVDEAIWEIARSGTRRAYLVVNKLDRPNQAPLSADFYRLGADALFSVSAMNGAGVAELLEAVVPELDAPLAGEDEEEEDGSGPIRVAIIGRPNVGKSTFANALLGEERYLTSDLPGTTRDAVDTPFTSGGRDYVLVDTAGVRKKKNVERGVELMSVSRSVRSIERCHVAALVLDVMEGITDQDKKLAALALERGRALVILLNKWDLLDAGPKAGDEQAMMIRDEMTFAAFAPHLFISALKGRNVDRFLATVNRVHANLFQRIPTRKLNLFYEEVIRTHPPSTSGTRTIRIKYLSQVQVNPPTILLFKTGSTQVPRHYLRFLQRMLREKYGFEGVPLRLIPK